MARQFICTEDTPVVQTKAGKVRGFILDGIYPTTASNTRMPGGL